MKRVLAVVSAGLVSLVLAACGGSGSTAASPAAGAGAGAASGAGTAAPASAGASDTGMAAGGAGGDAAASAAHAALPTGMSAAKAQAAGMGRDGAPVVSVTATDTKCTPDKKSVPAGKVWFKITNKGLKITELYLEKADTTELVQVEKIRAGQSGAFSFTPDAGSYMVACEPGMAGHETQVRSAIAIA